MIEDIREIAKNGHAEGVRVMDVTRLSEKQLDTVLKEGGDIYAAWCNGDATRLLQRAVKRVTSP